MMSRSLNAIIISASSDIGGAIAKDWLEKGWNVSGLYRNASPLTKSLESEYNMFLCPFDLSDKDSIKHACDQLIQYCGQWDVILFAPSSLDPIGPFSKVNFDDWERSISINCTSQLRILHHMLSFRNTTNTFIPSAIFFAGGGTNNAVLNYSSYTLSKIALIKMCELLDAEITDTKFSIVGPGWVKTKCHQSTLKSGPEFAGDNYQRTLEKLESNSCTPMQDIIDCINWIIAADRQIVSGRNFSVVYDKWGQYDLENMLKSNPDIYKLRRFGNFQLHNQESKIS